MKSVARQTARRAHRRYHNLTPADLQRTALELLHDWRTMPASEFGRRHPDVPRGDRAAETYLTGLAAAALAK
jgi:hypothetical protein